MDRRQRKTREAIFKALHNLLSKKSFSKITVQDIIDEADVGRATFYAHFETKEYLLKELCEELFCHIFDVTDDRRETHKHVFDCNTNDDFFLHLFRHLMKNDNHILDFFSCEESETFLRFFKSGLTTLVTTQFDKISLSNKEALPREYLINHISSSFLETLRWWSSGDRKETPEVLTEYFLLAINPLDK